VIVPDLKQQLLDASRGWEAEKYAALERFLTRPRAPLPGAPPPGAPPSAFLQHIRQLEAQQRQARASGELGALGAFYQILATAPAAEWHSAAAGRTLGQQLGAGGGGGGSLAGGLSLGGPAAGTAGPLAGGGGAAASGALAYGADAAGRTGVLRRTSLGAGGAGAGGGALSGGGILGGAGGSGAAARYDPYARPPLAGGRPPSRASFGVPPTPLPRPGGGAAAAAAANSLQGGAIYSSAGAHRPLTPFPLKPPTSRAATPLARLGSGGSAGLPSPGALGGGGGGGFAAASAGFATASGGGGSAAADGAEDGEEAGFGAAAAPASPGGAANGVAGGPAATTSSDRALALAAPQLLLQRPPPLRLGAAPAPAAALRAPRAGGAGRSATSKGAKGGALLRPMRNTPLRLPGQVRQQAKQQLPAPGTGAASAGTKRAAETPLALTLAMEGSIHHFSSGARLRCRGGVQLPRGRVGAAARWGAPRVRPHHYRALSCLPLQPPSACGRPRPATPRCARWPASARPARLAPAPPRRPRRRSCCPRSAARRATRQPPRRARGLRARSRRRRRPSSARWRTWRRCGGGGLRRGRRCRGRSLHGGARAAPPRGRGRQARARMCLGVDWLLARGVVWRVEASR
jgi:hypothetical protein